MSKENPGSATQAADAALKAAMLGKGPGNPEGFLDFTPLPNVVQSANVPLARDPAPPAPEPPPADEALPAASGEVPPPPSGDGGKPPADPVSDPKKETAERILRKYGTPEGVAKALVDLRRLQNATAEERKQLEKRLSDVLEYFEEAPGGELVLKVDKAASRLAAARVSTGETEVAIPTLEQAVAQVERNWREHYEKALDEESLDRLLAHSRPKIEAEAKRLIHDAQRARKEARAQEMLEVGAIAEKFWNEHGQRYNGLDDHIDSWLQPFSAQTRMRIVKENPAILQRIGEAEYLRANINAVIEEAFEAGRKAAGGETPSDGAAPRGGSSGKANLTPQGQDSDFKAQVLGAGRLAPLESLFKG